MAYSTPNFFVRYDRIRIVAAIDAITGTMRKIQLAVPRIEAIIAFGSCQSGGWPKSPKYFPGNSRLTNAVLGNISSWESVLSISTSLKKRNTATRTRNIATSDLVFCIIL